jgi:general secretion pathway protein I
MTIRANPRAGFTLLEILVAFAILGLAAAAIAQIFGVGVIKVARSENQRLAALAARSVLASVGADIPLEPGRQSGEMPGGIRWSLSITPYGDDQSNAPADASARPVTVPYLVTVDTAAGSPASPSTAELVSLRLKIEAPP